MLQIAPVVSYLASCNSMSKTSGRGGVCGGRQGQTVMPRICVLGLPSHYLTTPQAERGTILFPRGFGDGQRFPNPRSKLLGTLDDLRSFLFLEDISRGC